MGHAPDTSGPRDRAGVLKAPTMTAEEPAWTQMGRARGGRCDVPEHCLPYGAGTFTPMAPARAAAQ